MKEESKLILIIIILAIGGTLAIGGSLALISLLSGCTELIHEDAAGNITRYRRIGNQSIGEGRITLPDGSVLNFEKQESTVPILVIEIPGAKVRSGGKP